MKGFCALLKKDIRLMVSGKFFLMSLGFLILYTLYVNLGYIRFMDMQPYKVYLYDPKGTQKAASPLVERVFGREELYRILRDDADSIGIDAGMGEPQIIFYQGTKKADRFRADYAYSLLQPSEEYHAETVGLYTPEQRARREITCELLFFEIAAVGFLGIAAVLFREKGMGVIRVYAVLPIRKNLFLLSKLAVFLLSDLAFAAALTMLNVGPPGTAAMLPAVLLQTTYLSLIMALTGLICALLLKDFRQFTLTYLLITIFAASPVFLSANTSVKLDWIYLHPFYHIYMGLKNAYFRSSLGSPIYAAVCLAAIVILFAGAQRVFCRAMGKEQGI